MLTQSPRELVSFNIALTSLVAKLTPIVLANIPFSNAVTWKIHEVSTWLAVAFLSHMVLVLMASFVLQVAENSRIMASGYSSLPLRPDSIAACMYYVCYSQMVLDFEGLSIACQKERDKLVSDMQKTYRFGMLRDAEIAGTPRALPGGMRVGIDYA